jgi:broad specificity phosphatase PhoE
MSERRLALVRHGRSAHVQSGWLDAAGFRAWRAAYEAAGIRADERPPVELTPLGRAARHVLSSDAPRARESAQLLASEREVVQSALLRELDLHEPQLAGLSLPFLAWSLAVGGRLLALWVRGAYPSPAERERIAAAAAWLEGLAASSSLTLAVTHASFRSALSRELLRLGWEHEPGRRTLRPWSVWMLRKGASR